MAQVRQEEEQQQQQQQKSIEFYTLSKKPKAIYGRVKTTGMGHLM